jgi:aminoglycoside phosphotransferase (APT) family kinase protein
MIGPVTQHGPASFEQVRKLVRSLRPEWRLVRTWPLAGALSAQVSGVEVELEDGRRRTLVLRQYGAANLTSDPHAADTEHRLLKLLSAAGLPVPRPYFADESCAFLPGPCLVQEFIDGKRVDDPPDLADFTGQLAAALAAVHTAGFAQADVPFLADVRDDLAHRLGTGSSGPDKFRRLSAARAALTDNWPPAQVNEPTVLHGDYWPGNVLWRDGRLVGVVDWEDALFGDPLADLSVTRLEIRWFYGAAAMSLLTRQYQELRPELDVTTLPLWDLRAALRACAFPMDTWGLPAEQVAAMRAARREFVASALGRLAGGGAPDIEDSA